jgi:glycosyltransferase involved in cell wall biosynthesis
MPTTVIVPCKNEAGEIQTLLQAIMNELDSEDQLVVIEGGSFDATWEVVKAFAKDNSNVIAAQQDGKGKFNAVLNGIELADHDYVMIWDADGTVSFSNNLEIYRFKTSGEFMITGDRLKGSREPGSMQKFNFLGNWFFAIAWGLILRRRPLDTLCGTKKFPRTLLKNAPSWYFERDPYGDFSILAAAHCQRIPVLSLPVDYTARKYGSTNIKRWSGGYSLLKFMVRNVVKGKLQ